ncbi:MAG: undecaprenyl-diphosphate phosphatase [Bacillota bacterium]
MDFFELLKHIIFGFIQGLFEVLPISSSGQVSFMQNVLNADISTTTFFLVIINFGSLIAIIIFLRKTIINILKGLYRYFIKKDRNKETKENYEFAINILIAIIPIGIVGIIWGQIDYLFEDHLLIIIGLGSLFTATVLYSARSKTDMFTETKPTYKKSLYIGLVQVLAIIPGVSRLAITTTSGINKKLSYETALNFSLLLFIPISLGTIFLAIVEGFIDINNLLDFDISNIYVYINYFVSMIVSFITTYYALKLIYKITRTGKFKLFYFYNFIFGIIALIIGLMRH